MSAWTPAQSGLDPLEEAIHAVARHVLMPGAAPAIAARTPEGWHRLALADGRHVTIALKTRLRAERQWGPRAALWHDFFGQATVERDAVTFAGRAVIDVGTRAFLEVDCQLTATGRVG
jgi:hypothetical protein